MVVLAGTGVFATPPIGAARAASTEAARDQRLALIRARIQQLQSELALNANARKNESLAPDQRQALEMRSAELINEIKQLQQQLQAAQ